MADDLLRDPAREGVAGDAGERIRSAALEGKAKGPGRLRGAPGAGHLGKPLVDAGDGPGHLGLVAALHPVEGVEDVVEGVATSLHEPLEVGTRVRPRPVVDGEHRPDVGMDHEPREDPQHVVEIVRARAAPALGVGDRDDAVHAGGSSAGRLLRRVAGEPVRPGGNREHDHEVARADAASAVPPVAVEGAVRLDAIDLFAGAEGGLVELEGLDRVGEVLLRGEREVDVALRERLQDLRVADVLAGGERAKRNSERKPPREEPRALGHGLPDEAVPFEDGMGEPICALAVGHLRPRFQSPGRDGDVVAGRGHPRHAVECKTLAHRSFPPLPRHASRRTVTHSSGDEASGGTGAGLSWKTLRPFSRRPVRPAGAARRPRMAAGPPRGPESWSAGGGGRCGPPPPFVRFGSGSVGPASPPHTRRRA